MTVTTPPPPEKDFARVANELLRNRALTFAEKGMLAYIGSHAAYHSLTMEQIVRDGADGADAVRTIIRQLELKGYLTRTPVRGYRGRIERYDYAATEPATPGLTASGPTASGPTASGATACRPTASGEAATSHDLGKQDVPAGGTACRETASCEPGTKKTTPKKTKKTNPSAVPAEGAPNAGLILKGFIDWLRLDGQGAVELPQSIIARHGRAIKKLLDEGTDPDLLKRALALMHDRGKASQPQMLPGFVVDVQNVRRAPSPRSFTEQADEHKQARKAREDQVIQVAEALMERQPGLRAPEAMKLAEAEIANRLDVRTSHAYIDGEVIRAREVTE